MTDSYISMQEISSQLIKMGFEEYKIRQTAKEMQQECISLVLDMIIAKTASPI